MIGSNDEWNIELSVKENFTISVEDAYTVKIDGTFDENEIVMLVLDKYNPEDLYINGELEKWAEENGYILDES